MNHVDYARASGQMPPEFGKCARCTKRTEVDPVHVGKRCVLLCRKCRSELEGKPDIEFDLDELPF